MKTNNMETIEPEVVNKVVESKVEKVEVEEIPTSEKKVDPLLEDLKQKHDLRVMVGTSYGVAVKENKNNPEYKYYAVVRYTNKARESAWLIDKNLYRHPEGALLRAMGLCKIGDQESFSEFATRLLGLPEV